jgi:hypothetical protein
MRIPVRLGLGRPIDEFADVRIARAVEVDPDEAVVLPQDAGVALAKRVAANRLPGAYQNLCKIV